MGVEMLRCAQHDRAVHLLLPPGVTLSRSEGSVSMGVEMLRCAQHDRADLPPIFMAQVGALCCPLAVARKMLYVQHNQLLCLKLPIKVSAMWALFNGIWKN